MLNRAALDEPPTKPLNVRLDFRIGNRDQDNLSERAYSPALLLSSDARGARLDPDKKR